MRGLASRAAGSARRRVREPFFERRRRTLASRFLRGQGIEIGALHKPLWLPPDACAHYVDRKSVPELRREYPELDGLPLVPLDVVEDGERLETIEDNSLDFVIANHFIEHTQNPLGTIEQHLRVLRPGGVLYMAVPDKRQTFDRDRPLTDLEHLLRDYREGPHWSRRMHYEEWARYVDPIIHGFRRVEERSKELEAADYSIHFHVWTPETFRETLALCLDRLGLPLRVAAMEQNQTEFITVLERAPGATATA